MKIETVSKPDLELLKELQPVDWPDIVPHFQLYTNSSFCLPLKLTVNNKIVAIGAGIIHNNVAWLAHIIVHTEHRKNGFGKMITEELVNQLKNKNFETINLIATDLGAPVYEKIGFETETEYVIYKDSEIDFSNSVSKSIYPFEQKFAEEIKQLDAVSAGEDRFFRLQEHFADASVCVFDTKVEGFYLPNLGEGLIVAQNPIAGIELMKLRLQKSQVAILPIENESGIQFLLENKFKLFRKIKRMRLGKKRDWLPENLYNRVSGQIG